MEEYDHPRQTVEAARSSAAGSSAAPAAGSSAIAPALVLPGFLPEDYVNDGELEDVMAEVMERTKEEAQQVTARRQRKEELDEIRLRQAIEASRADRGWGVSDSDSD